VAHVISKYATEGGTGPRGGGGGGRREEAQPMREAVFPPRDGRREREPVGLNQAGEGCCLHCTQPCKSKWRVSSGQGSCKGPAAHHPVCGASLHEELELGGLSCALALLGVSHDSGNS
jgi:hypothetical protein